MAKGRFFNGILAGVVPSMNVNFIASTQSPEFGATVSFTNLTTPTPDFNFWDFGDGTFSTASNPDKIYGVPGTYSVTLNAMDSISGGIETKNDYIFVEASSIIAEGGTETTITVGGEDYRVHTFTQSGTFSLFVNVDIEYLIVAGGGGGGGNESPAVSGGGGAGGLITNLGTASLFFADLYGISIGQGGNGGAAGGAQGSNGENTTALGLTAFGGGGGGAAGPGTGGALHPGLSGANGGGGGSRDNPGSGGTGTQGNNGGNAFESDAFNRQAGGGGGAGTAGENGVSNTRGGNGGDGLELNINGTDIYYAGGGGGGSRRHTQGTGGLGGGGNAVLNGNGSNATPNTGGGGGGCGTDTNISPQVDRAGGNGGSGIVIIRYKI